MDADALLADLDPEQRSAVATENTLVAVIAGAGSGKTRVLTRRVAHRIAAGSADPRHTLVLTFTREAAGELRRRLGRLGLREHIEAGTFHSVMLGILRQRWEDTGRRPATILSDRDRLVHEVVGNDRRRATQMISEVAWAGARGLGPDTYARAARQAGRRPAGGVDAAARVLGEFTTTKRRRGLIDFDDVLVSVLDAARRDPEFADVLRWRFRHLLVDEAQDLNPVQHQLIDILRAGRDDVFMVGDPAQAIYGFNGADPALLTEIERHFPGVEIVRLPVNHRCTPQVVDSGSFVLSGSGLVEDARSARADGPGVREILADDEHDEAARVAGFLSSVDSNRVRSGQVAVLARTNAQLRLLERELSRRRVPLRSSAHRRGSPTQLAVTAAASNRSASLLREWAHSVLEAPDGHTGPDDAERAVAAAAFDYLRGQPRGDGAGFRAWVASTNPFDNPRERGVEILTFHAAKGREWHTVIVTGVETGLVPHRSATTKALREEEARLLYVAMTRASDELVISRARRRGGYARDVSPFVDGLPSGDAEVAPPPPRERRPRTDGVSAALRDWRAATARRARILPQQVCSDRDLAAIARHRPRSVEEIVSLTSLGPLTAARLGPDMISVLQSSSAADGSPRPQSVRSTTTGA